MFTKLGGFGLDLTRSRGCVVDGCYFHDISGSAVQIGQFQDALASEMDRDNIVRNTIVSRAAAEFSGAAGISHAATPPGPRRCIPMWKNPGQALRLSLREQRSTSGRFR